MTFDKFTEKLIRKLEGDADCREQIVEKDEKKRYETAKSLEERLRNDKRSVIVFDLKKYRNRDFKYFSKDFVKNTYETLNTFAQDQIIDDVLKSNGKKEFPDGILHNEFKSFLVDVASVVDKNVKTVFIFNNYEEARECWRGGFGEMREILSQCSGLLSAVVIADRPMHEVSREPLGGSPFYNIFGIALTFDDN